MPPPERPEPRPAEEGAPSPACLRRMLAEVLRSDADLDAFCIDYFPPVFARFSSGMDRVQKVTLLFTHASRLEVVARLRDHDPGAVAKLLETEARRKAPAEVDGARAISEASPADGASIAVVRSPDDARFAEFLAAIEAEVAGKLRRMPAVAAALAGKLGLAPGTGEGLAHALIHDKTGKEAVVALNAVDEALKRETARVEDRRALKDILLQILPFATDWRPLVQRGRAALDTGARFVDLPLGTPTMAEAILAGIDCRPCRFVTDGRMGPAGAAIVRKPVAEEVFLDPSRRRLAEATVGLLAVQLLGLAPDAPELRDHARSRRKVDEALAYYRDPTAGDDYLPRWILLDDPLLAHVGERAQGDEDHRVATAVAVLGEELPHLRVVRMGVEADGETFLALHVGGMWRKRF